MSTTTQTATRHREETRALLTTDSPRRDEKITPVGFGTLLQVETRKQVDTLAGRWMLIGMAAITAIVFVILLFNNGGDHSWMTYFGAAVTPFSILLPIIAIMASTSEWGQRTAMATFTLEPRRGRVIAAKVLSSLGLGAVLFALGIAMSAIVHQVAITLRGVEGDWGITWWIIGGAAILLVLSMLQGSAFGLAVLNTPFAIVAFLALPLAMSALNVLIPSWSSFFSWADINQTLTPLFAGVEPSGKEWAQIAVSCGIWIALPMVIGVWRVFRSEVK